MHISNNTNNKEKIIINSRALYDSGIILLTNPLIIGIDANTIKTNTGSGIFFMYFPF
jgi:hypothetical protein